MKCYYSIKNRDLPAIISATSCGPAFSDRSKSGKFCSSLWKAKISCSGLSKFRLTSLASQLSRWCCCNSLEGSGAMLACDLERRFFSDAIRNCRLPWRLICVGEPHGVADLLLEASAAAAIAAAFAGPPLDSDRLSRDAADWNFYFALRFLAVTFW